MTNRLAQSQSLYLRKHAENPIDWWSWCEKALDKVQRGNKPIFLSYRDRVEPALWSFGHILRELPQACPSRLCPSASG